MAIRDRFPVEEYLTDAILQFDERCAACRNPFGVGYFLSMGNRIVQNVPEHSHFGLTRAQGKRMNVSTEGNDYPMCLACQLILGNNKSDHWASLEEFGKYSREVQDARGYKILRRVDVEDEAIRLEVAV